MGNLNCFLIWIQILISLLLPANYFDYLVAWIRVYDEFHEHFFPLFWFTLISNSGQSFHDLADAWSLLIMDCTHFVFLFLICLLMYFSWKRKRTAVICRMEAHIIFLLEVINLTSCETLFRVLLIVDDVLVSKYVFSISGWDFNSVF